MNSTRNLDRAEVERFLNERRLRNSRPLGPTPPHTQSTQTSQTREQRFLLLGEMARMRAGFLSPILPGFISGSATKVWTHCQGNTNASMREKLSPIIWFYA
jgi:hypothetical protein